MSYKFDALITILNKLDSGEAVTVSSLMNDIEMSERTIYRYIQTLQVAGFPIVYDKSRGIYAFDSGYSLKKLNLSIDEALAFALAKKLLGNFGTGMEKSLNKIEEKLYEKRSNLPGHIILAPETPAGETDAFLATIHQAITNYKKIEMKYNALHSQEVSQRKVNPYYLFFKEGFWYMRGYCHESQAFRTFALDRIVSLKVLDKHFLPKDISPEEELSDSFGAWIDGELTEVVLIFDPEVKAQVLRKKWHKSQQVRELKDGRIEMKLTVKGLEGIKKWIYQWILNVSVSAPQELVTLIRSELKKEVAKFRPQ